MLAIVIWILLSLVNFGAKQTSDIVVIPPMPNHSPTNVTYVGDTGDETEWIAYHWEAEREYMDEFTALFNSYQVKRAKNGALMIRQGNSGSYKFAKKG